MLKREGKLSVKDDVVFPEKKRKRSSICVVGLQRKLKPVLNLTSNIN